MNAASDMLAFLLLGKLGPLQRAFVLWVVLAVLGAVGIAILWRSAARWRQGLAGRRRRRRIKSAWAESGRRMPTPTVEELEQPPEAP